MTKLSLSTVILALLLAAFGAPAAGEDGYDLWLRYTPVAPPQAAHYRAAAQGLVTADVSPTIDAATAELKRGLAGMLGRTPPAGDTIRRDGTILYGTPTHSPTIAALHLPLEGLGNEGFIIRTVVARGRKLTVIAANSDIGVLYGAFRYLRLMQTRTLPAAIDIREAPAIQHRLLDHWDNLDRTVERGYAGFSIWNWPELPDYRDPRYTDYARANASIGINGTVLNNVNAQAEILDRRYLAKVAALADVFRPYGIRVYLSVRFSAPMALGGLKTADPLDPAVIAWWKDKTDEIYRLIPNFGGFLVKANSEGQPGPQDYGRNHADGANMLADVLEPHGGIVMWRAFVYANNPQVDRVEQAYNEFVPLDGKFHRNVIVQVKNGPLDFQPREPFSPLFGAMKNTSLGLELQITKEYLGFATHLVYLGTLWQEVLESDTFADGPGTTVAKIVEGHSPSVIAGVANIGTDRDWCGSIFNQANWYAFGRLAWNPKASARDIAEDWSAMTFTADRRFVGQTTAIMMASREAAVDYMTPLGLAHLMGTGHHYGPAPWVDDAGRADWNPVYYHRADKNGIGVDRTKTGSDAAAQYAPPLAAQFEDPKRTPEKLLLWFHHLPWDYKMKSGHTLWEELVAHYDQGVADVERMRAAWATLKRYVDTARFDKTADFFAIQEKEAEWWRDASIAYFQSISGLPLPAASARPAHGLAYYQALKFPYAPGTAH